MVAFHSATGRTNLGGAGGSFLSGFETLPLSKAEELYPIFRKNGSPRKQGPWPHRKRFLPVKTTHRTGSGAGPDIFPEKSRWGLRGTGSYGEACCSAPSAVAERGHSG